MRNMRTARAELPTINMIAATAPRTPVQAMTIPDVPSARTAIRESALRPGVRSERTQCPRQR